MEQQLEKFIRKFKLHRTTGLTFVPQTELNMLKSDGFTVEHLLDYLVAKQGSLLHGSRAKFNSAYVKPSYGGYAYSADKAGVAIMKALISNKGLKHPGLRYPYFVDNMDSFKVHVFGMKKNTIGKKGYIYVINQRNDFENTPKDSWQYVTKESIPISAIIPIEREDFKYPIIDGYSGKIIT